MEESTLYKAIDQKRQIIDKDWNQLRGVVNRVHKDNADYDENQVQINLNKFVKKLESNRDNQE